MIYDISLLGGGQILNFPEMNEIGGDVAVLRRVLVLGVEPFALALV